MRAVYVALEALEDEVPFDLTTKTIHERGDLTIAVDVATTGEVVGVEILASAIGRVTVE